MTLGGQLPRISVQAPLPVACYGGNRRTAIVVPEFPAALTDDFVTMNGEFVTMGGERITL
jgi:hypothetical protein